MWIVKIQLCLDEKWKGSQRREDTARKIEINFKVNNCSFKFWVTYPEIKQNLKG